jgi:tRNA 5-methylaminomethyl-2-thiouridine biosynthesis bifunctional protein
MADLLLSRLEGEPLPLETDLLDAVDPGRFLLGRTPPAAAGDDA